MEPGSRRSAYKVLVVDDEPSIQMLVTYNLQRAGFDVHVLSDGMAAYEKLVDSADLPDLVILDVMLPGMDGMEICRRIRQHGVNVSTILLTAREEEIFRMAEADDYVTKPFSPRDLVERARTVLRREENP